MLGIKHKAQKESKRVLMQRYRSKRRAKEKSNMTQDRVKWLAFINFASTVPRNFLTKRMCNINSSREFHAKQKALYPLKSREKK
jgi:hypothetical protein